MQNTTLNTTDIDAIKHRLSVLEKSAHRPALEGAENNNLLTKSFVDYLRTGAIDMETKAMAEHSDEDGGFLAPEAIATNIAAKKEQYAPLRSLMQRTAISTDALDVVIEKGAPSVGWAAETDERAETDTPKFVKTKINVHELYAKPRVTQKLLDDSQINIEEWLVNRLSNEIAKVETQALLFGDGHHMPEGILTYFNKGEGASGQIDSFKTGSDDGFDIENPANVLFKALDSLKSKYLPGACWIMSRSTQSALRQLTLGNSGVSLWQHETASGILNGKPCAQLLGYPVVVVDEMPALENGKPAIIFGNLKEAYHLVERQGIQVLRDPYSAKPFVEFYTTARVGGAVVNAEAVKIITVGS